MKTTIDKSNERFSNVTGTKEIILDLQDKFDEAELHGDTNTLQELLAEDFLSIGPKGFVLTKEQWVNRHAEFKYDKLKTSDKDIRLYDKAAIIRNIQRNEASYKNEPVKVSMRVSQVWINEENEWKLAGIQFSPLAEKG